MNKDKIAVFGFGDYFKRYEKLIFDTYEVNVIFDNDSKKWGDYKGIPVMKPTSSVDIYFDYILIVLERFDFNIIPLLLQDGFDISVLRPFFRPGYLKIDDYRSSVVSTSGGYGIRIDINDGSAFLLRNWTDFVIFNEIILNADYRLIMPYDNMSIIDIGMNVGLASLYYASNPKVGRVYGFEAFKPTYKLALENFALNGDEIKNKIKSYNYALSNYEGVRKFRYLKEEPGNMGIVAGGTNDGNNNDYMEEVIVKEAGKVLSEILEPAGNTHYVVKCDCEGSEYEIFESLKNFDLLDKISAFLIETHLGRGDEIINVLADKGFKIFAPVSREGRMGMIYACK